MDEKEKGTVNSPQNINNNDYKNGNNSFVRQRVLRLFQTGKKFSAVDITKTLTISDPRGHIRDLRDRGYDIRDYWVKSPNGRYKIYYLQTDTL